MLQHSYYFLRPLKISILLILSDVTWSLSKLQDQCFRPASPGQMPLQRSSWADSAFAQVCLVRLLIALRTISLDDRLLDARDHIIFVSCFQGPEVRKVFHSPGERTAPTCFGLSDTLRLFLVPVLVPIMWTISAAAAVGWSQRASSASFSSVFLEEQQNFVLPQSS